MSGDIDNGQRRQVAFGPYAGPAGICDRGEGRKDVAIFADLKKLRSVRRGSIEGVEHELLAIERSAHVTGMIVLTVKAITEE